MNFDLKFVLQFHQKKKEKKKRKEKLKLARVIQLDETFYIIKYLN
jgi:hypothetical protein